MNAPFECENCFWQVVVHDTWRVILLQSQRTLSSRNHGLEARPFVFFRLYDISKHYKNQLDVNGLFHKNECEIMIGAWPIHNQLIDLRIVKNSFDAHSLMSSGPRRLPSVIFVLCVRYTESLFSALKMNKINCFACWRVCKLSIFDLRHHFVSSWKTTVGNEFRWQCSTEWWGASSNRHHSIHTVAVKYRMLWRNGNTTSWPSALNRECYTNLHQHWHAHCTDILASAGLAAKDAAAASSDWSFLSSQGGTIKEWKHRTWANNIYRCNCFIHHGVNNSNIDNDCSGPPQNS